MSSHSGQDVDLENAPSAAEVLTPPAASGSPAESKPSAAAEGLLERAGLPSEEEQLGAAKGLEELEKDSPEGEPSGPSSGAPRARIVVLSVAAGIGGFLFGYDTGVISGALLYIRDDFPAVDRSTELQEAIVSTAVLGAAVGAAAGGWVNDRFGRKSAILAADAVFAVGAALMAAAWSPWALIAGRVLVGLGVGVASMTVPLYIAEAAPAGVRGALVSVNVLMITTGQFVSYLVNFAFTQVPGTWRWMLGMAAAPAILQAVFMLPLPESPRWLFKQGKVEEAIRVLRGLRAPEELRREMKEMVESADAAQAAGPARLRDLVATREMRMALTAGVGLQVLQQLVGINTVMYYSPSIVELAGYASHRTALLLSLIVAGMNAAGTVVGIVLVDRCGRRKLVMSSLAGVVAALALLALAFRLSASSSPAAVAALDPVLAALQCPLPAARCAGCLRGGCGFCAALGDEMLPGSCLVPSAAASAMCRGLSRSWFTSGCPSRYGALALAGLALYIAAFAPGMGPVPWAVNSEIYPLQLRGLAGGAAATANWLSNFVVAETFLTLVKLAGTSAVFLLFGLVALFALGFVYFCLPETKGLSFQEMEHMWQSRARKRGP